MGTLRWRRQAGRGDNLPPGRHQEAQRGDRDLGRLQEGWPTPYLNRSPWDGGRKAPAGFLFRCVGQGDRIRKLDQSAMSRPGQGDPARFAERQFRQPAGDTARPACYHRDREDRQDTSARRPPWRTPGGSSTDAPPSTTPALCQTATYSRPLIEKPIMPPLAWAGLPS